MKFARRVWIETEIELILPTEFEACLGQGVVADLSTGVATLVWNTQWIIWLATLTESPSVMGVC